MANTRIDLCDAFAKGYSLKELLKRADTESGDPGILHELLKQVQNAQDKAEMIKILVEPLSKPDLLKQYGRIDAGALDQVCIQLRGMRGLASATDALFRAIRKNVPEAPPPKPTSHLRLVGPNENKKTETNGILPEGWRTPTGYKCSSEGIISQKIGKDGELVETPIAGAQIFISKRYADVDSENWTVEVQWPGGKWLGPRSSAFTARELPALADKGAPVSSDNAGDIVKWLRVTEMYNADIIPVKKSISRLGWTTDDKGHHALQNAVGPHMLRPEPGHETVIQSLRPRGTWEQWLQAAQIVHKNPIPAIMLAASVASIMLQATGAAPFIVDLSGPTSKGKTTSLRWAASAWGDVSDSGGMILPWSASPTAIENHAKILYNYPLILDDTKKVSPKKREDISSVVYHWGSGQGRARAKPDGLRPIANWRSILLSTGESPLSRLAGEHGGARLRMLSFNDAPFPAGDTGVVTIDALDTWGHIGPKVAEWVKRHWTSLADRWRHAQTKFADLAGGASAAHRVAGYAASVFLGAEALRDMGVPMPDAIPDMLVRSIQTAVSSADIPTEAWTRIESWLVSQRDRITNQASKPSEGSISAPSGGWIGRVIGEEGDLAIMPDALDDALRKMSYEPNEIYPQWLTAGRIIPDASGNKQYACKWFGVATRMYRLHGLSGWSVDRGAGYPNGSVSVP